MASPQEIEILSSFVQGAPPGELANVIADIESLTLDKPRLVDDVAPAFAKYNEDQFTTVQLPGGSQSAIVSSWNALGDDRYYDPASSTSFSFDHRTQQASSAKSHVVEGAQAEFVQSALKSLAGYVSEHYERASYGVYPAEDDNRVAVLLVSNKYSPQNYWNGRWRSEYVFDTSSGTLEGSIRVDVHYYEDGNVRLLTDKAVTASIPSATGSALAREIATIEKKYQEELNKSFVTLSEGAFKGLRRQLPVTRQKVEWDKVASYRLGQDIGGGNDRR